MTKLLCLSDDREQYTESLTSDQIVNSIEPLRSRSKVVLASLRNAEHKLTFVKRNCEVTFTAFFAFDSVLCVTLISGHAFINVANHRNFARYDNVLSTFSQETLSRARQRIFLWQINVCDGYSPASM